VEVIKLLTVFGLGVVELWAAIPTGLALQLHPVAVGFAAALGAVVGTLAVVLLGKHLRAWLLRGHGKEGDRQHGRIYRIWERYGVVGLGLLAPLLVGAPLGTALGLALGAPPRRLLFWMSAGIVLWSTALTLTGALGLAGIQSLAH
jgi:membrane protein YqaA with SNARE-associated domain